MPISETTLTHASAVLDDLRLQVRMLRLRLELRRMRDELLQRRYRPDQPRAPRGTPIGGQFIDDLADTLQDIDDASGTPVPPRTRVAQLPGGVGRVDLLSEESRGGHTVALHVAKSPQFLMSRVTVGIFDLGIVTYVPYRAGSFPSLEAANKLVSSTLAKNMATVALVASGTQSDAFVIATFASATGLEAFRDSPFGRPVLRVTYGVGVVIRHDPLSANGFLVVTAYPRQE